MLESNALSSSISLSVFMPCYNEQGNIKRVVENAQKVLSPLLADYEIIIVNDGKR